MRKCEFCESCFDSVSALANHTRWKHKREKSERACQHCGEKFQTANVELHEVACGREKNQCKLCEKPTRGVFCDSSCAATFNNRSGTIGYAQYRKKNGIKRHRTYRDVCFEQWEHKCALCDWTIVIDVHHIDSNHRNNDPRNLIPLCQNHHMMSRLAEHRDAVRVRLEELRDTRLGL